VSDFIRSDMNVRDHFDEDDDLRFEIDGESAYLNRRDVRALRDFLSERFGDVLNSAPTPGVASAMSRADALKLAEETTGRIAPTTNGRGYTDGTAPLAQRTDAILRFAEFLMSGGHA